MVSGALGLTFGALLVEAVRLLVNRKVRQRQLERVRVFGLKTVLRKWLFGDPQAELDLISPQRRQA